MIPTHDAFAVIQHLTERLGRQPTMVELLDYAGADPAGMQADPPDQGPPPSQRPPERGDGPLTAAAQAADLIRRNPEILRVREQMVRQLLFGLDAQNGLLLSRSSRFGGMGPTQGPTPGPNVKRGIGGSGGLAIGSGPAGGL